MATQLELGLRNPDRREETISVFFDLYPTPLAARWAEALKDALSRRHLLEKHHGFLGFPEGARNETYLAGLLNEASERISAYRGDGVWKNGYEIRERCRTGEVTTDLLNRFHHHFEVLQGATFQASSYYLQAPASIRLLIRQINYTVHELEILRASLKQWRETGRAYPTCVVEFLEKNTRRFPLEEVDYEQFTLRHRFGSLHVAYCQTGKTPYEAWRDNDQLIGQANVNGMQFYSANFAVRWGPSSNPAYQDQHIVEPFHHWIRSQGLEIRNGRYYVGPDGRKHGLGFLPIGEFAQGQFRGCTVEEIQSMVGMHSDVFAVRLRQAGRVHEGEYPYLLGDIDYRRRVETFLSP